MFDFQGGRICRQTRYRTVGKSEQPQGAPESMFTTVTPGAEELRAASRGATPPNAAP